MFFLNASIADLVTCPLYTIRTLAAAAFAVLYKNRSWKMKDQQSYLDTGTLFTNIQINSNFVPSNEKYSSPKKVGLSPI